MSDSSRTRSIRRTAAAVWLLTCVALAIFIAWPEPSTTAVVASAPEAVPHESPIRRSIEDIRVGTRVRGHNPDRSEATRTDAIDPLIWRVLTLVMALPDNSIEDRTPQLIDIQLLRPLEWIEESGAHPESSIWLDHPEMHFSGWADVLNVGPCPEIPSGSAPVVTGTFRYEAESIVELGIDGLTQPVRCTPEHPFWSADRLDFVAASELRHGEHISTSGSTAAILTSITPRAGPQVVHGLEVYGEHVYHVSDLGLLTHNVSSKKVGGKTYRFRKHGGFAKKPGPRPRTRKNRSTEFPSSVRKSVKDDLLASRRRADGKIRADNGKFIDEADVTIEHIQPVVDYYNQTGYNTSRKARTEWYNNINNLGILPKRGKGGNSSGGGKLAAQGITYRQDTGPNYTD